MDLQTLDKHVAEFTGAFDSWEDSLPSGVPGLFAYQTCAPSASKSVMYSPIVCLTLQGMKETVLGDQTFCYRPGEAVIVSHYVPVTAKITKATREEPYRSLICSLDLALMRGLYDQMGSTLGSAERDTISAGIASPDLIDNMARYFLLKDKPREAPVLAPLIRKELHFRVLLAPHGQTLRQLLNIDSHSSKINRAINYLRENYRKKIRTADLAKIAGMGVSSFHGHFQSITKSTPLKYQKDLRLMEARRLLATEGQSVSEAAYSVGYESPTQFSREFSRKFGVPPSQQKQNALMY